MDDLKVGGWSSVDAGFLKLLEDVMAKVDVNVGVQIHVLAWVDPGHRLLGWIWVRAHLKVVSIDMPMSTLCESVCELRAGQ